MKRLILIPLYLTGGVFSARLLLAMFGISGPVNPYLPDLATPGYVWPVLAHSLYGLLLFCLVVATGTATLSPLRRLLALDADDIDILGVPAGLLTCLALSLLCCLGPAGKLAAALAVAGALLDYYRRHRQRFRIFKLPPVAVTLLALLFGAHLAFLWKPTTAASPVGTIGLGDVAVYSAWYNDLKASPYPFYNLGVEGEHVSYFNNLHSFYALSLDFLPGFDIYLFILTSLSTFYILAIAYMLSAMAAYRSHHDYPLLSTGYIACITLVIVAAARYPSWILESPPAVFLAPVALSVMYGVVRAGDQPSRLGFALALAVTGSAISKVVSAVVLCAYPGLRLVNVALRRAHPAHFIWLGILSCAIAVYVFYMLRTFGPLYLAEWVPGPESWQRFRTKGWSEFLHVIPVLLKDTGLLLIAAGTVKLRNWALAVTAILAVVSNFLFPFLFTPTPTALLMLIVAYMLLTRTASKSAVKLIVTGSLLFLPHHFHHDPGDWHMTLLWVLSLGTAAYLVLRSHAETAGGWNGWRHVAALFLLGTLSLTSLAQGDLRLGKKRVERVPATLYDIWVNTRLRTPANALVFTDQTGDDTGRLSGWNDYSLMTRRQFYISSWSTSQLRHRASERRERLAENQAVIGGQLAPAELPLSRPYAGYYVVVRKGKPAPENFSRIYENDDYVLYEIVRNASLDTTP